MFTTRSCSRQIFLILILLFPATIWAQDGSLKEDADSEKIKLEVPETLIVGTRVVPPFAMLNEDKQWEGISIDLLREVKAELEDECGHDIKLEFKIQTLKEMLAAVSESEVDIVAAALTMNYEREKTMDFTHSFHTSGLGIAVGAKQTWLRLVGNVRSDCVGDFSADCRRTIFSDASECGCNLPV